MSITLNIKQGIPFDYLVTLTDVDSNPIDLVGATIKMKIRATLESNTVLAELSTINGRITLTNTVGQFRLFLDETITNTLSNGVFDILVITASNEYYLIAENGKIKTKQIVSR